MIPIIIYLALIVFIMVLSKLSDLLWYKWMLPKTIEMNERTRWSKALGLPKRMSHRKWVEVHKHMEAGDEHTA